jgi:hypothetical protein
MHNILSRLNIFKKDKSKAFTLFVSLLVSSLLLAIGFSIGNILIKQLVLTQTGSGTQVAFYAADSAAECALFWDRKDSDGITLSDSPFGTSTSIDPNVPNGIRFICGSGDTTTGGGIVYAGTKTCDDSLCGALATAATTTFFIGYQDPQDPKYLACAHVIVFKKFDVATGEEETTIDSRGYNTDLIVEDSGTGYGYYVGGGITTAARCNLERPRVVERGLYLTY